MIKGLQVCFGLVLIFIIVPQTTTENLVLRRLLETGYFTDYSEAKKILTLVTWLLIFFFLLLTFYLSFIY